MKQKIKTISTGFSILGGGNTDNVADEIQKAIKELNAKGFTAVGMLPLSFTSPIQYADEEPIFVLTEVAILYNE